METETIIQNLSNEISEKLVKIQNMLSEIGQIERWDEIVDQIFENMANVKAFDY